MVQKKSIAKSKSSDRDRSKRNGSTGMCQNLEDNTDLRAALDQHESGEHGMQIFLNDTLRSMRKFFHSVEKLESF